MSKKMYNEISPPANSFELSHQKYRGSFKEQHSLCYWFARPWCFREASQFPVHNGDMGWGTSPFQNLNKNETFRKRGDRNLLKFMSFLHWCFLDVVRLYSRSDWQTNHSYWQFYWELSMHNCGCRKVFYAFLWLKVFKFYSSRISRKIFLVSFCSLLGVL